MRFPRIKLTPKLLSLAYRFVDLEASSEVAQPDGRFLEYGFVIQRLISVPPAKALDVGCTAKTNYLTPTLVLLGWEVYGIDLREFRFQHPNFHLVIGDIRATEFPDAFFDCVYAVSTIEHIGLSGRYGVDAHDPRGDARTVAEIARILRPEGKLLVTVPYGQREVQRPATRVYDKEALAALFANWKVETETYYTLDLESGVWQAAEEAAAAQTKHVLGKREALACLELTLRERQQRKQADLALSPAPI